MSNQALTYVQAGFESTFATAVAAARRVYAVGELPEETRKKEYVSQARQNFVENFEAVETHTMTKFKLEEKALSYSDLAWWLAMCAKGGVSPTGTGPYTWTYVGTGSSEDLKSATFEMADSIGAFQIPGCLVDDWEISGKGGVNKAGVIGAKFGLVGQKVTPGHTMTAAIAQRDLSGTYMPFHHATFYLDNSAGGIGGTEVATLMEFSIKSKTKWDLLYFGGDSGYFGGRRREKRHLEIMVKLLFDSTSYSEFTNKFRTNAARFGQIKVTDGADQTFALNFATKFDTYKWPEDGATRAVSLMGRTIYDPTLTYDWQMTLTNAVASVS